MTMRIKWGARLEALADALLSEWIETSRSSHAPFGKICVVVNDSATESWLKHYFLLVKQVPQVLLNLEFVRLQQFVNDWMQAQVHGIAPRNRQAGLHPYSQEVMVWRIYQILSKAETSGDFPELQAYVGNDQEKKPQRRFALAEQLSQLYDDYLNSRFQLLRNWETGEFGNTVKIPAWQIDLYRRLVAENPNTYASDYACALQPGSDATEALRHDFPKYLAIHVFDIPFMPEPTLRLLEKISEALPITFWNFNPLGDWLGETPSQQEAQRKLRQQLKKSVREQRDLLAVGQGPSSLESAFASFYDSPEERLLGTLGPGARGLLGALCDDNYGDIEVLDQEPPFASLKALDSQSPISVHACHSPRRELEIIRDGLLHFFETNSGFQPQDAIVLCADWNDYVNIIDSVFTVDRETPGYLPLTVQGLSAVASPLCQAFVNILEFRRNRFEVSTVFNLLSVPDIREKFGLDENGVTTLRDMVKTANIHWGYNDQDVTSILGKEAGLHLPYTWQRGFDRMITEMLHGIPESDYELLDVQAPVVSLHLCGHVEGERAKLLASLWKFVTSLKNIREKLAGDQVYCAEEISSILIDEILDVFFVANDQNLKTLNKIRKAIRTVVEDISLAGLDSEPFPCEVFLASLVSQISNQQTASRTSANAVTFAPLQTSTATPHQLVWICGLNNGNFPRNERKPVFNVLGNHPSLFDVTARERDGFALLKAVLSARHQLAFSYVGKDIHSNETLPPSVLLTSLIDYFKEAGLDYSKYNHPLHAYDRRYFLRDRLASNGTGEETAGKPSLPPSYSANDCQIAQALARPLTEVARITPFPLAPGQATDIELDDLIMFYTQPQDLILKRWLHVRDAKGHYHKFYDEEFQTAKIPQGMLNDIFLYGFEQIDRESMAQVAVEMGKSPNASLADAAFETVAQYHDSKPLSFARAKSDFNCYADQSHSRFMLMSEACAQYEALPEPKERILKLTVCNCEVRLHIKVQTLELETSLGPVRHVINFGLSDVASWLRHLAINALDDGGDVVSFVPIIDKKLDKRYKPVPTDKAKEKLVALLEMACSPLPPEFSDFSSLSTGKDKLPPEYTDLLSIPKEYFDRTYY